MDPEKKWIKLPEDLYKRPTLGIKKAPLLWGGGKSHTVQSLINNKIRI